MDNIYNAIQNLYNMDKTTWQEVLAELYNLVSKIDNKFDLFELKFGSLLGEQVTRELKKMYDNGSLASLINDKLLKDINSKVDTFKTEVSEQLDTIESQKLDKDGTVTMANMGQDVKNAMTGGTVPYVGEGSVNEITFNQDLKKSLCSYKKEKLEVLDGYFDSSTNYNTIGTSSHYKSIKKTCMEGERYSCDCSIDTSTLSKVIFYNESGSILSSIGKGENGTYKNFEFTVPEGAISLTITSRISLLSEPVLRKLTVNDTNEINNNINYLRNEVYKFIEKDIELKNGFYETSKVGFQSNSQYWSVYQSCSKGERYSASFNLQDSVCAKVIFYDSSNTRVSWIGKGEVGNYTDFEFEIPSGISYFSITSKSSKPILKKYANLAVEVEKKISDNSDNIEYLTNEIYKFNEKDIELKNGFYETSKVGFQPNSQYWSIYESCIEGEKYKASFNLQDTVCAKVIFYDNDNTRISYIGKGETGNYVDFEFKIPTGVSYFSITSKSSKPILKKYSNIAKETYGEVKNLKTNIDRIDSKYPIYAYVNWNVYYFMWKYDNTRDIIISLNKVGQSSLYQLSHFYTVPNEDKDCSGDFTLAQTQLKATSSDFVGPYKVLAKNNIDGENISEENIRFTGGWHGFNGNQTGGATGRNVSINVYVDGKKMSSTNRTKIGGRKIDVVVVNEINASNTAKSDGTGRNVLQETVTYTLTEGKIDVDVKIKALEDITIKEYYGLQIEASGYKENVSFISDDTIVTDYTKYTYVGTKQEQICNTIISNGTDKCIIGEIIGDFGLGRRKYVADTSYTAWSGDYGKSYFYLVKDKDLELNENQCAFWRGSYKIKNRII